MADHYASNSSKVLPHPYRLCVSSDAASNPDRSQIRIDAKIVTLGYLDTLVTLCRMITLPTGL
jgi:hypothetical protein